MNSTDLRHLLFVWTVATRPRRRLVWIHGDVSSAANRTRPIIVIELSQGNVAEKKMFGVSLGA